ncbi:Pol polyprotein [Trachymyrmex septentrionalis]|uniref:Pol polyprotein n=1 Tax=Trachymyrmex septentrionalis TaxID=34720 RepID=A0A195F4L7_9HYME|nr:Pol polyprotein [Trachymyrmex septentrionalis]
MRYYDLIIIDRFTRWKPIPDISVDTIAFYANCVARFGKTPAVITTDRGSQFESQLFQALTKLIGSKKTRTTTYHPASNEMMERWHRSLKTAIISLNTSSWTDVLPTVLLGHRIS